MADIPVDSSGIIEAAEHTKNLNDELEISKKKASELSYDFLQFANIDFTKADNFFRGMGSSLGETSKGFGSIGSQWKELTDNIKNTDAGKLGGVFDSLIGTAKGAGLMTAQVSNTLSSFGADAKGAVDYLQKLIGSHIQAAEAQNQMMHQMIDTAAATGNLNDVLGNSIVETGEAGNGWGFVTGSLNKFSNQLDDTRADITNLSNSTGVGQETLASLYNQVAKLPNVFDESGKAVRGLNDAFMAGQRTGFLDEITQVASGTGQSLGKVMETIKAVRESSNLNNQASLEFIARESSVSSKLGVDLGTVDKFMKDISTTVGELGNNTDASAKIFENFESRLNQVGISAEKSRSIIFNFTKGIADLDVAHRSFLSQQSGGPGGLAGGYKISNMIADGKLDEVTKIAEESLRKQMGGRIVTRQEAEQSETGAAQYTKQLQLLRQGPLGSLATNEQDAMKLLEGMTKESKGKDGAKLDPFKDKNELLNETMGKGQAIQNITNTELTKLNNSLNTWLYGAEKSNAKDINSAVNDPNMTARQRNEAQATHDDFRGDGKQLMGKAVVGGMDAAKQLAETSMTVLKTIAEGWYKQAEDLFNNLFSQKGTHTTNNDEKAYFDAQYSGKKADRNVEGMLSEDKKIEIDAYAKSLREAKEAKDQAEKQLQNTENQARNSQIAVQAQARANPTNKPDAPKHNPPGSTSDTGTDHSSDQSGTANQGDKKSSPGLNNAVNDLNNIHLEVFITCPQCHEKHHANSQAHAGPQH